MDLLIDLPEWNYSENKISRTYIFKDFLSAMQYMQMAALACENARHHPTWTNTYNKLHVELQTHDAGNTVTVKDTELAQKMDQLFMEMNN